MIDKKRYLAKIIALDNEGLQIVSACCAGAKVKLSDIKYLKSNKIFLFSLKRNQIEKEKNKQIDSICKFDFVDQVKSKNINQKIDDQMLELLTIDYLKNKNDYEINLIFDKNRQIVLNTETIEIRLEDQTEIQEQ